MTPEQTANVDTTVEDVAKTLDALAAALRTLDDITPEESARLRTATESILQALPAHKGN